MNIDRFIASRKELGLSQSELAEGICTQATLSRFENNGQVPNLKIVLKLCQKLNLPLSDLFPKVGFKYTETISKLNEIEFLLITCEYEKAQSLLAQVSVKEVDSPEICLRYLYLKGFLMALQKEKDTDVLFVFDQILLDNDLKETDIYRLLAYTGVGLVYMENNELDKAEYYFNKVLEQIYHYSIETTEDIWRVLHIVFQCGVFYSEINELEVSDALLEYAVLICSDNHVTYYLARAYFQLVLNSIKEDLATEIVLERLYDARAFAKINHNDKLLDSIAALEMQLLPEKEGTR